MEAVTNGDDRDADDIAHEYADGCADVIYTYSALELYMDSSHVRDLEDEAEGYLPEDRRRVGDIATICAYLAIREEMRETLEGLREDATHSRSILANAARMRMRVEDGNARVWLHDTARAHGGKVSA